MQRSLVAALLLAAAPLAFAQLGTQDPDWKEVDAPRPPAFNAQARLIPLDIPRSELRFGVDPASINIGRDGIVRYVVVASMPGGVVNAMYEGIRCGTAEVKVYARYHADTGWKPAAGSDWRSIRDGAVRHSLYIARNGACQEHTAASSAGHMVRELSADGERRRRTDTMR